MPIPVLQRPLLKRLSLTPAARLGLAGVLAVLGGVVPAGCALARAEAPPEVEQEGRPPDQVLSTRDDAGPDGEVENPTGRVARLSFAQGGVTLLGVGETERAPATLNRPIAPGDDLTTAGDGRAEVELGGAAVRLGANSALRFLALDERALRLQLSSGMANVRVRDLGENDAVDVETPQGVMSILRPGNYRLEVNPAGQSTIVKVSSGALEARGTAGQSFVIRTQQSATLTGTTRLAFSAGTLGAPDTFDEWTLERDQRIDRAQTAEASKYVPNDTVGAEDLDGYGTWRNDPDYGYVWAPTTVVSGWSPYSYGRYSYISGWGWTWIDDAPWGFAPFHYGSWVTIGGRWNWVPGPRHGRYVGRPGNGNPGYWNRPGNRPGWNRPGNGNPREWHTPRPPGGSAIRSSPPLGVDSPRNGYRYLRPEQPRTSGGAQPGAVVPTQPSMGSDWRNNRNPRYDRPNPGADQNQNNGRYRQPVAPPPRMERPSPPPQMRSSPPAQQQSQPAPSNPNVNSGGRFDRGGGNRGPSRGNSTRER